MKVLLFLTFFCHTVFMHKHFPAREHPRALPIQNHQNYHNKPAANEIVMPPSKRENDDVPFNVTGKNCQFNLCDEAVNYPDEYITNFLKSTDEYDSFFNAVVPDIVSKTSGDENICQSRFESRVPKFARNMANEWRIIANVDELYVQSVQVELCDKVGTPCQLSEAKPVGIETSCEQRYAATPLLAFDNDKKPIVDIFQLPSCCVCVYKKV